jgi:3-hydroxy-9,10-secoandrosta-1,3,5(10)-triene-9,17-dione monooxygenase reductase component
MTTIRVDARDAAEMELTDSATAPTFRDAISHLATGVTVITTLQAGEPVGMTASAVTSLSLDPVLLLVCIDQRLRTHEAINNGRRFVVNVLGDEHAELALQFARPSPNKFSGVALRPDSDLPILADAIATFVCDVHERYPGGDHTIFTGFVRACSAVAGRRPLLYFRSGFGRLHDPEAEAMRAALAWDMPSLMGSAPAA